jgi:8-oxo-dGTP pyrophosphatase MutT (NUDIX family)
MRYNDIIEKIEFGLKNDLPGFDSQKLLAPEFREEELKKSFPNSKTKKSAILILIFEKNGTAYTVMTKRSMNLNNHPGQISFPGGRIDKIDKSSEFAALRETNEELGLKLDDIKIIGELSSLYIPPSDFIVQPFIGTIYEKDFNLQPNPAEVDRIMIIPLKLFLNDNEIKKFEFKTKDGKVRNSPCFYWQGECIWGASAMIISELRHVLKSGEGDVK